MKERPIIFSTDMVKAVLDGRKTQTRRVIKPQPIRSSRTAHIEDGLWEFHQSFRLSAWKDDCLYGQVGDRLWVKETHYRWGFWRISGFTKTGRPHWIFEPLRVELRYFENPPDKVLTSKTSKTDWYKRPSLFMPRWASRITLEITEVRVERLQEITDPKNWSDFFKEGLPEHIPIQHHKNGDSTDIAQAISSFRQLWDSLNAKRGYGWEVNPWVWVISFKVIK